MTNHQSIIVERDADVSLTILTSMLVDVRELVITTRELGQKSGIGANNRIRSLEELDDSLASLRMTALLMICSAWLIDRISVVSARVSDTEWVEVRGGKSLKEQFDYSGHLKNGPASPLESKIHNVCLRLMRIDKGLC
jgi:hypothetical protein